MPRHLQTVFLTVFCLTLVNSLPLENYYEELDIVPLPNGFISATFKFLTHRHGNLGSHYDLFPKAIGEVVQKYAVDEFHLSLSQNFWRSFQWGYQPPPATPTGAQLWAWFNRNASTDVDTQWRDLVHALSGLFCASFSQIDGRRLTVTPVHEFRPRGAMTDRSFNSELVRYAILPSDNVCTENLTPWKKLLPCKSLAGIGSLLGEPMKLFSGHYLSLGIDVRRICQNPNRSPDGPCGDEDVAWELTQTLTVVLDGTINGMLVRWSFERLFGTKINSHCGVATSSQIFVDIHRNPPVLTPPESRVVISDGNRHRLAVIDVNANVQRGNPLDLSATYNTAVPAVPSQPPAVYVHSYIADSGLQSGRLVSRLFNTLNVHVPVLYSHSIPWFLRTYYHTLRIICGGKLLDPMFTSYQPARDRKRPHYFEIAIYLPPMNQSSSCELSISFDRQLLRYGEYPPDAHHGFPIPGPMISFFNPSVSNHTLLLDGDNPMLTFSTDATNSNKKSVWKSAFTVVYGESLLINLPTPDFSMPYNVICLVCTVVALAFGPIHSLTTKSLAIADAKKAKKEKLLYRLLAKLRRGGNDEKKEQDVTTTPDVVQDESTSDRSSNSSSSGKKSHKARKDN